MSNPLKGEVELKLGDGREFKLVLDHEALIEAEGLYRKPLPLLMGDAMVGFVGAQRALFYGALRAYHPMVTPKEAGEIFLSHADDVAAALTKAGELAAPKDEGDREPSRPPAKARTGARSGGSGAKPGSTPKASGGQRRAALR